MRAFNYLIFSLLLTIAGSGYAFDELDGSHTEMLNQEGEPFVGPEPLDPPFSMEQLPFIQGEPGNYDCFAQVIYEAGTYLGCLTKKDGVETFVRPDLNDDRGSIYWCSIFNELCNLGPGPQPIG